MTLTIELPKPLYSRAEQHLFELIMLELSRKSATLAGVVGRLARDPAWKEAKLEPTLRNLRSILQSPAWHDFLSDYEIVEVTRHLAEAYQQVPKEMGLLIAREKRQAMLTERARVQRDRALGDLADARREGDGVDPHAALFTGEDEPLTRAATPVTHPAFSNDAEDEE